MSSLAVIQRSQEEMRARRGPTPATPRRSDRSGAIRMARLLDRRRRGFRCYSVEVSEADIDALVARGFLGRLRRGDPGVVERAIGGLLDRL